VAAAGLGQLPGQQVRALDREAGASAGQQRRAVAGVPDQSDPAARPGRDPDLADRVEVEALVGGGLVQQLGNAPPKAGEPVAQQLLEADLYRRLLEATKVYDGILSCKSADSEFEIDAPPRSDVEHHACG